MMIYGFSISLGRSLGSTTSTTAVGVEIQPLIWIVCLVASIEVYGFKSITDPLDPNDLRTATDPFLFQYGGTVGVLGSLLHHKNRSSGSVMQATKLEIFVIKSMTNYPLILNLVFQFEAKESKTLRFTLEVKLGSSTFPRIAFVLGAFGLLGI